MSAGEASCDKTVIIEGIYVTIKIKKNPPLRWYKKSIVYEIFREKYVVFMHE